MWSLYCKSIIQEILNLALKTVFLTEFNGWFTIDKISPKKKKKVDQHDRIGKWFLSSECATYPRLGKKPASIPEIYNLVWSSQTVTFCLMKH